MNMFKKSKLITKRDRKEEFKEGKFVDHVLMFC